MRLIDADRLLRDEVMRLYYHLPNGDTAIPIVDIEHAPTIGAVEVVRCKDCAYQIKRWNGVKCCEAHGDHIGADYDFCSNGRRVGEADE